MDGPCANGAPNSSAAFANVLVNMNAEMIALGVFLIFGSIISTLPQHIKIWRTRSCVGVSFLWLFLGNVNQFAGTLNAIVLKFPQEHACTVLGFGRCLPSLLSMIQLFALWVFTFPIYIWCLYFMDLKTTTTRERRMAKILFCLSILFFIVAAGVAAILISVTGECSHATVSFGAGLGILSTIVTFVQYSPQIYSTFKSKSVGAFSVLMLAIQIPGTMIIVYFLVFVSHENVTTWISYVSSMIQQIILMILLIYYGRMAKKAAAKGTSLNDEAQAPLISPYDSGFFNQKYLDNNNSNNNSNNNYNTITK